MTEDQTPTPVKIILTKRTLDLLFPEDSQARIDLQQCVIAEIVRRTALGKQSEIATLVNKELHNSLDSIKAQAKKATSDFMQEWIINGRLTQPALDTLREAMDTRVKELSSEACSRMYSACHAKLVEREPRYVEELIGRASDRLSNLVKTAASYVTQRDFRTAVIATIDKNPVGIPDELKLPD